MPLEVKELTDENGLRRYDALVPKASAGSVFATRSWHDYAGVKSRYFGVFKGSECIAGVAVPHHAGHSLPVTQGTPWTGIVSRSEDEGEQLQVACEVARYLRREFGMCSLTLPPEWNDVRGFLWDGWSSHVRYTYRGQHPDYEKRLKFRNCFVVMDIQHEEPGWQVIAYHTGDSRIEAAFDWRHAYYLTANQGGTYHAECINTMIRQAEDRGIGFDLVGCNSPHRSLFKRSFGGDLTPYYFVTTGDPADVKEFWGEQRPRRIAA